MEIKIDIPRNDWTKPTEVRQDVVQQICDIMLSGSELIVYDYKPAVALVIRENRNIKPYLTCRIPDDDDKDETRVHGVEMEAAFKALLDAGYYLYGSYCISDGKHTYGCSKTPYHKGMECTLKGFVMFID